MSIVTRSVLESVVPASGSRWIQKERDLAYLRQFFENRKRIVGLTGAGVSTASGIPDYRSPGRPPHRPMEAKDFVSSEANRRRYWARSFVGYGRMCLARPSFTHKWLADAERAGTLRHTITCNVDGLHRIAGSRKLTELHGQLHTVQCRTCQHRLHRFDFQILLQKLNPTWNAGPLHPPHPDATWISSEEASNYEQQADSWIEIQDTTTSLMRPDGDTVVGASAIANAIIPDCLRCGGGFYMPEVVFFGGSVPEAVTAEARAKVEEADGLLVMGATLTTYSAFRLARLAREKGIPIILVNIGNARIDPDLHIEWPCCEVLASLANNSE